jgi:hypothetical protein
MSRVTPAATGLSTPTTVPPSCRYHRAGRDIAIRLGPPQLPDDYGIDARHMAEYAWLAERKRGLPNTAMLIKSAPRQERSAMSHSRYSLRMRLLQVTAQFT